VNGDYDEDEDGTEEFRPTPHPDDRLWRHPSEIAAMHAAQANAEIAPVPIVQIAEPTPKLRRHAGLKAAAGIVAIGAAALTIGVVSSQGGSQQTALATGTARSIAIEGTAGTTTESADREGATEIAADVAAQGEDLLTARVHDEVASSLPRIQAVTASGMREGSGMFVTDDGHIATSAGLIESAEYVLAWTDDGQRWKAHLIASDPVSDVAVIQIESDGWPAVSLGNGDDLRDGQYALALNHDENTISVGEVTSVSSPLLVIDQAAAVPGSAIVDDTGAVIAMITDDGTNSHGTRAWMLEQVAVDLIASGDTSHNWLGLVVSDEPGANIVVVDQVTNDSPAARAGLRVGDLIDSFDGNPIVDAASLHRQVQRADPGDDAVLTVTRNNHRNIIIATLALAP
jgi:serine protease Do